MPKLVKPSATILGTTEGMLDIIENAARMCYLSEPKEKFDGPERLAEQEQFLRDKIRRGHHSVLEHGNITVHFVFDRGVSHEEVRHRLQAISQESTRYCNYAKEKHGSEIAVVAPFFFPYEEEGQRVLLPDGITEAIMNKFDVWMMCMRISEWGYLNLLRMGASAQEARDVLPNSLKTEMTVTANCREWRHILKIRTEGGVHPQMAEVMVPLLNQFRNTWPVLFDDITHDPKWGFFLEGN